MDTSSSIKSTVNVDQDGKDSAAYVDFNGGQGTNSLGNLGIISQSGEDNVAGLIVGTHSNFNDFRIGQDGGSSNIAIVAGRKMTNRNEVTIDMVGGETNRAIVTFNNQDQPAGASRNNVDIDITGGSKNFVRTKVLGNGSLRNTVDIDVKYSSENRVFTTQSASNSYADISLNSSTMNQVLISQANNNSVAYIIGDNAHNSVGVIKQ